MICNRGWCILLTVLLASFNINFSMAAEYFCKNVDYTDGSRGTPIYLTLNGNRAITKDGKYKKEWIKLKLPDDLDMEYTYLYLPNNPPINGVTYRGSGLLLVPKKIDKNNRITWIGTHLDLGFGRFSQAKCELMR